jgi:tetratricopeptide (TPR) repeat protein
MSKTILKLFGAILLGSAIFACKKSFLERLPQASLSEAALSNEKGVNASLIAAYAALDGWTENGWNNAAGNPWPAAGSNWIWGSVTSDDAYPGSQPNDQIPIERMRRYEWNTDDSYIRAKWQTIYMGAGRANVTLRLLAKANDMSAAAKDATAGEARFLRAHYHFDGYKMWKNIPFVDETVTDFRLTNDADPFPKIEADLKFAIEKLPLKTSDASGRATKGAAQAYLARAYMYIGKYAEAKPLLQAVIASGKYSLVNNYHDVFNAATQNNPEMVFVYKASVNDGAGESANGNWGDRLIAPHGGSPVTNCCGFHQPSFNLVNAFKTDAATGLPLFNTYNNSNYNPSTDFVDPRLDWTVGRMDVPYLDWGPAKPNWIRDAGYGGPFLPKKNLFHKAQVGTLSTASGWQNVPNAIDIPILRYSDVLLMAAECEIETNGDLNQARNYINQVRERAGKFVQGPGTSEATIVVPIGTGIFEWAKYKTGTYPAGMSQTELKEAVRFERRLELAMEGYRLFDLRRWGVSEQVLKTFLATEKQRMPALLAAAQEPSAKHKLFPIPSVEIELSRKDGAAQLKQNPGY